MAGERDDRTAVDRHFVRWLALVLVLALVVRVVYVLVVTRHDTDLYDALYYELQARGIADGDGFFTDPFQRLHGTDDVLPAADHPPLTVFVLLPAALLGLSELGMRFTMVLLGVATVALVAVLARALAGPTVGLVAGAIAAVDPNLWANDGLLMSEPPGVLLTTAILLVAYRCLRGPPPWPVAAGLGALAGLGMLTRAEFALFVPVVVLPALWVGSRPDRRAALRSVAVAAAGIIVVLGPWVAYNLSRFERPTFISTNDGLALRAANCPQTYHGSHLGWVDVFPPCALFDVDEEQSVMGERNRSEALEYMASNLSRIPQVAAARLGRNWNLYRFEQTAQFTSLEGRPVWVTRATASASWVLLPLAVFGVLPAVRRRFGLGGRPVWPLVAVFLTVNAVLALWAGGLLRYRASAEPAMVVLAAMGIVAFVRAAPKARG